MKILFAPDSFKGTMSSMRVIELLADAAKRTFPDSQLVTVPIADGGEGTVEALVTAAGGQYRTVNVTGPLGEKVSAVYGVIGGKTAVIEMAQASGIMLLKEEEKNPLHTTTYGTGELIKAALDHGIRRLVIGIGGSATNDGGIGAAQALGVRFLDRNTSDVGYGGRNLCNIARIDVSNMDPRIKECEISVICDVSNPLTGPAGATYVYGPQKGAGKECLELLESGMENYLQVIKQCIGMDMNQVPGSGAAGGLGAAMVAFFGARLKSGIDTILDFVDFESLLKDVDLVVTGEGKIDSQSAYGKVPVGIAKRCKSKGIKVIAIAGCMGKDARRVFDYGIDSIMVTVNNNLSLEEALLRAGEDLFDAADRMFRLIKLGMDLKT